MDLDPLPAIDPLLCAVTTLCDAVPAFGFGNIIAVLCAVVALCVSAFVSGSEIAYFSLNRRQVDELEESGDAPKALALIKKPERLLATILIANNLVNVTIVVLLNYSLNPLFAQLNPVVSFIVQSVILTFLILLFGEILPKLMANTNTLRWARFAAGGITFMSKLFAPISALLVHSTGIVNRVVTKRDEELSTRDLSQALEITDVKTNDDKEMLEGILRFGDKTAAEIMTPRVDIFWGDMMLSDFDEIDRSMVNADDLFRNLRDIKTISANYLDEEQKDIIRRVWGESRLTAAVSDFWLHAPESSGDAVASRFVYLWEVMADVYHEYHVLLRERGVASPGGRYRAALERINALSADDFHGEHYVFVGFNDLSVTEMLMFNRLRELGVASFF